MRIHFSSSMDSLLLISGDLCIVTPSTVCMMQDRRRCLARRAKPRRAAPLARVANFVKKPPLIVNVTYLELNGFNAFMCTPLRTLGISGLKSRVLKLTYFSLKMMVKSGLEFILKLTEPLQSCCCPVQEYLPRMAELAWQLSRYL